MRGFYFFMTPFRRNMVATGYKRVFMTCVGEDFISKSHKHLIQSYERFPRFSEMLQEGTGKTSGISN